MRLTQKQIDSIRTSAEEVFGEGVKVWLFGSRVDDSKRGGDIDLLIRPSTADIASSLMSKVHFLNTLEKRIGERKVDVVLETDDDARPIVRMAHDTGVLL